jgi:hypothetical protein
MGNLWMGSGVGSPPDLDRSLLPGLPMRCLTSMETALRAIGATSQASSPPPSPGSFALPFCGLRADSGTILCCGCRLREPVIVAMGIGSPCGAVDFAWVNLCSKSIWCKTRSAAGAEDQGGMSAHGMRGLIDEDRHEVVAAPHPAARRRFQTEFREAGTFSEVNRRLEALELAPIEWAIN